MGKYGITALKAVELYRKSRASSPVHAWNEAAAITFPTSESARAKGCPRGAFLGLCESGAILGIPAGQYCSSTKNKEYALKALALLKQTPSLANDQRELWNRVIDGEEKVPNHQMDVVISIWNAGLFFGSEYAPARGTHPTSVS